MRRRLKGAVVGVVAGVVGMYVSQPGCGSFDGCSDCGPCGFGPRSSFSSPIAMALTTGEETAFVSSRWDYVWGQCGFEGNGPTSTLHIADLALGSSLRIDMPATFIFDLTVARGEVVMLPDSGDVFLTMPVTPPFTIESVPAPSQPRSAVRAGDAAFILLANGNILRHAHGDADIVINGDAGRIVPAFGVLYAINYEGVSEIDPDTGSPLRTLTVPCTVNNAVPVAPSHLLLSCDDDATIALLSLATGAVETQTLPAERQIIAGSEDSPVALASFGFESGADPYGTLAIVPVNGLPGSPVTSTYGGPFPAIDSALFLRNERALVGADFVWQLALSTSNGATGSLNGTDARLYAPATAFGESHALMAVGEYSDDQDARLRVGLREVDEQDDILRSVILEGPPVPEHD